MNNYNLPIDYSKVTQPIAVFELLKADTCYKITVTQPTVIKTNASLEQKTYQNAPTFEGGPFLVTYFIQGNIDYLTHDKGTIIAKNNSDKLKLSDFNIYSNVFQYCDRENQCFLAEEDGKVLFCTTMADRRTRYSIEVISYDSPTDTPYESPTYLSVSHSLGRNYTTKFPIFVSKFGNITKHGLVKGYSTTNVYFKVAVTKNSPYENGIANIGIKQNNYIHFFGNDNFGLIDFNVLLSVNKASILANTSNIPIIFYKQDNDDYIYGKVSLVWGCIIIESINDINSLAISVYDNEEALGVELNNLTQLPLKYNYKPEDENVFKPVPGKSVYYQAGNIPVFWNGSKYIEASGVNMGTPTSGTFANKPTVSSNNISVGFRYFCTDKQTTEGATNGIEIIHKGSDVWVDALGRVVN